MDCAAEPGKTCLHTHTAFCDGRGTVDDFCEAAVHKGFSILGFSAHAPLTLPDGLKDNRLCEDRLGAYCDAVRTAQKKWRGKLTVLLGLEAEYVGAPGSPVPIAEPAFWDKEKYGLDYVIGSTHFIPSPQGAFLAVDGSPASFKTLIEDHFDGDALEAVRVYYACVRDMVTRGGFDILGHIDLIKKNGAGRGTESRYFSLDDAAYISCVTDTAQAVREAQKQYGFAVEVNCGAIARGTFPDTYPDAPFLKELKPLPCIITGDAHRSEHLGAGYARAEQNLAEAGITGKTAFPLGVGTGAVHIPAYL